MWVEVAFNEGADFHGHLANSPFHPEPALREGDGVWFRQEHVIDVLVPGEKSLSENAKLVTCDCHGISEPCHVCEHVANGSDLGFNHGETADLRPDAWCDECDKLVADKDSWEDAEREPKIKLVCGGCYDEIRNRNGGLVDLAGQ